MTSIEYSTRVYCRNYDRLEAKMNEGVINPSDKYNEYIREGVVYRKQEVLGIESPMYIVYEEIVDSEIVTFEDRRFTISDVNYVYTEIDPPSKRMVLMNVVDQWGDSRLVYNLQTNSYHYIASRSVDNPQSGDSVMRSMIEEIEYLGCR